MSETRIARRPSAGTQVAWNPLVSGIDRFFGDTFLRPFFTAGFDRFESMGPRSWVPAVDIQETDDAYLLTADLPSFDKNSVDVELESNVLTISGERQPVEDEGHRFHRLERGHGRFRRSFTLPSHVKADKVKAKFRDGVLFLTIPKAESAKARRILVN